MFLLHDFINNFSPYDTVRFGSDLGLKGSRV